MCLIEPELTWELHPTDSPCNPHMTVGGFLVVSILFIFSISGVQCDCLQENTYIIYYIWLPWLCQSWVLATCLTLSSSCGHQCFEDSFNTLGGLVFGDVLYPVPLAALKLTHQFAVCVRHHELSAESQQTLWLTIVLLDTRGSIWGCWCMTKTLLPEAHLVLGIHQNLFLPLIVVHNTTLHEGDHPYRSHCCRSICQTEKYDILLYCAPFSSTRWWTCHAFSQEDSPAPLIPSTSTVVLHHQKGSFVLKSHFSTLNWIGTIDCLWVAKGTISYI